MTFIIMGLCEDCSDAIKQYKKYTVFMFFCTLICNIKLYLKSLMLGGINHD